MKKIAYLLEKVPIHPLFFYTYPVLALIGINIQEIYLSHTYRFLFLTILGALLAFIVLSALTRNIHRGALLATITAIILFSYGHIYVLINGISIAGFMLGRHRFLLAASAILFAVLVVAIWKMKNPNRVTLSLNVVGLTLCLIPLVSISRFFIRSNHLNSNTATRIPDITLHEPGNRTPPDIYYIILDGYARSDFMSYFFDFDNSDFLEALADRGFYVVERSRSNHNHTALSLAASLNLTFAQELGARMVRGDYPEPFTSPIQHSAVRAALEKIGYTTIGFRSGYRLTELLDADVFLSPDQRQISISVPPNAFEDMLLHTTILKPFLEKGLLNIVFRTDASPGEGPTAPRREVIQFAFQNLPRVPETGTPRFVFAHIIALHSPYIFDRDGNPVDPEQAYTLLDTAGDTPVQRIAYREQAIYMTHEVEALIDEILNQYTDPPVIIIQADHGAGTVSDKEQRLSIFNAILIDETCHDQLYPTMTPVNTFRVVFNCYFDAGLPLIEDQSYWSRWPRHFEYEFELVPKENR
jgi:hypothetical protein